MLFAPAFLLKEEEEEDKEEEDKEEDKEEEDKEEEDKEEEKRTTAKAAKAFRFSSLFFFVGRCVRVLERERERERALFGFPSSSFVL